MQPEKFEESSVDQYFRHFLTGNGFNGDMASTGFPSNFNFQTTNIQSFSSNSSFNYPVEVSEITADTSTPEARALAALKNHKEAEKRRRERINSHLDSLRTLLPACTSKTDKASLLGKVVERVRELKQQTSEILQLESSFPCENDEIQVLLSSSSDHNSSSDGKILIKASVSCEDRCDLIPDLIEMLKSLHLSPLRAEMVSLGGRIRNVIVLAGDKDHMTSDESLVFLIRDALKSLVQRSSYGSGERSKRRRLFDQRMI